MKTIFLVDDIDIHLMVAEIVLEGTYKTYTIPSAAEMFKLLEEITPDLILLDIDMPTMDGFEAMSILKTKPKTRDIPVIFLSSHTEATAKSMGFSLGAADFLIKPYDPALLVERIEKQLVNTDIKR